MPKTRSKRACNAGKVPVGLYSQRKHRGRAELDAETLRKYSRILKKPRSCQECGAACRTKLEVYEHMAGCCRYSYRCEVPGCPFACLHKQHFKYHAAEHEGRRDLACDRCSYACSTKTMLRSHMRQHEGFRFACADCDFASKQPSVLRLHLDTARHRAAPVASEDGSQPDNERDRVFENHIRRKRRMDAPQEEEEEEERPSKRIRSSETDPGRVSTTGQASTTSSDESETMEYHPGRDARAEEGEKEEKEGEVKEEKEGEEKEEEDGGAVQRKSFQEIFAGSELERCQILRIEKHWDSNWYVVYIDPTKKRDEKEEDKEAEEEVNKVEEEENKVEEDKVEVDKVEVDKVEEDKVEVDMVEEDKVEVDKEENKVEEEENKVEVEPVSVKPRAGQEIATREEAQSTVTVKRELETNGDEEAVQLALGGETVKEEPNQKGGRGERLIGRPRNGEPFSVRESAANRDEPSTEPDTVESSRFRSAGNPNVHGSDAHVTVALSWSQAVRMEEPQRRYKSELFVEIRPARWEGKGEEAKPDVDDLVLDLSTQ